MAISIALDGGILSTSVHYRLEAGLGELGAFPRAAEASIKLAEI